MADTGSGPGQALLPGVTIAMGGRDWLVPPLTLGQLRRLAPDLGRITAGGLTMLDPEAVGAVVKVVTAALSRNYPDMTEQRVAEELLDLGNANEVLAAVLASSGLRRAAPGEGQAARGNGASFTASSPPPSATDPATSMS
jgi:hypothetical protein